MVKVYWDNDLKKDKGTILDPTAPFKGICQHCKQRKTVRNYAYNYFKRLGTLCKNCFKEIDSAFSDCLNFNEVKDYFNDYSN